MAGVGEGIRISIYRFPLRGETCRQSVSISIDALDVDFEMRKKAAMPVLKCDETPYARRMKRGFDGLMLESWSD